LTSWTMSRQQFVNTRKEARCGRTTNRYHLPLDALPSSQPQRTRSFGFVFWSTDLDPFRYHRMIEYCPYRDCNHFSFIRSLVILYSRVVTPTYIMLCVD
jgi:hypothetical protein